MCGFAGELSFVGAADRLAVERMAATMRPRGPDGAGAWAVDAVALAHRRLKIIDLSAAGDQPMVEKELGLTIVFTGCIYNHQELRRELERDGYRFFSRSDTEVILKAYDRWGGRCVERLFGMFAFALFDHGRRRLTLARDRLGIKPLYLTQGRDSVRFASTLPGLLAGGGVDTEIDPVALHHFFSWHGVVPAPYTILKGVRKLAPATVMTVEADGESAIDTYWSADFADVFQTDHHKIHVPTDRMLPALDGAIAAMSEPMVSHDAVAFYLLSQEVSRSLKVVQSGQGADEVFAGYSWYPPLVDADGSGVDRYEAEFFDRPQAEFSEMLTPDYMLDGDPSRAFVEEHFGRPGAEKPIDRALRLDAEIMLVDDPVKRVDNMTMAWGLEARTPFLDHELVELAAACPAELKLAHGGKGVLKTAARSVVPEVVIDRPKGYFPVPALSRLEGATLELVRAALDESAVRARGVFRPEHVRTLLSAPNDHLTTLEGSKLWQLALLELWFEAHGV